MCLPDSADFGLLSDVDDDAERFARRNVSAAKEHVLLVLVDSARVGHGFIVLDDRDRFASEKRLVNSQRR